MEGFACMNSIVFDVHALSLAVSDAFERAVQTHNLHSLANMDLIPSLQSVSSR